MLAFHTLSGSVVSAWATQATFQIENCPSPSRRATPAGWRLNGARRMSARVVNPKSGSSQRTGGIPEENGFGPEVGASCIVGTAYCKPDYPRGGNGRA